MTPAVSVRKVAEELDGLLSEATAYLNRRSGEVFSITELEVSSVERADEGEKLLDWERESLPQIRDVLESEDWLVLPNKHDVHERSIMRDFSHSITDSQLQHELERAIQGAGAFRHFKELVYRHGIEEQWIQFKAHALEQIVVDWLEEHDIPYTHDDGSAPTAE